MSAEPHGAPSCEATTTLLTFSLVFAATTRRRHGGRAGTHRTRVGAPSPAGWITYDCLWEEIVAGGTDALLGVARIYQAKVAEMEGRFSSAAPELARAARALLPPADQDAGRWDHRQIVPGGFACWEFSPRVDTCPQRRMVVLAAADRDRELSAWTWSRGDPATAAPEEIHQRGHRAQRGEDVRHGRMMSRRVSYS